MEAGADFFAIGETLQPPPRQAGRPSRIVIGGIPAPHSNPATIVSDTTRASSLAEIESNEAVMRIRAVAP
jgi:hypothetical protein